MDKTDKSVSIADSSKPNAGRLYDFLLGGHHNFEVDRQAAQQFLQLAPYLPQVAHIIRWFLGEAVRRLIAEGYTYFLDFASGLPTVDHIHHLAPKGSKVIYSDLDPITVAYGQEIIKDNPDVRYILGDAGKAEDILSSSAVSELFGANRRVAIGFNGIAWFISDEQIGHSLKVLYDWAEKGSKLFLSDLDTLHITAETQSIMQLYEKIGQPTYTRNHKKLKELFGSWKELEPGFRPLEEWFDMEKNIDRQTRNAMGGSFKGAILAK
jgi:S-adenosyl methyltransferase